MAKRNFSSVCDESVNEQMFDDDDDDFRGKRDSARRMSKKNRKALSKLYQDVGIDFSNKWD
jgi:hypothetical protein